MILPGVLELCSPHHHCGNRLRVKRLPPLVEVSLGGQARFKRRGHKGLTVEDLRVINAMREAGERLQLEWERKKRLGIVDYYVPPPGKKYR